MAKTTIDFKAAYGSNFLLGTVTSIDLNKKQIVVNTVNEPLKYTDLVIAVGSVGPFPGKIFVQTAVEAAAKYSELGNEVHKNLYAHHSLRMLSTISFYLEGFLFCLILL